MVGIAQPVIEDEEIQAVNRVLSTGMLAQGPKVAELERAFAAYCGTKYALAVNSGTAAIHSALFAAGVEAGDEVITTPFSFIATINPILMLGAKPVLVDIDPVTFNIDPNKVKQAITPKTKVIMPVHLYGQPCDWSELQEIARENNVKLIEDACQAVGALYKGKKAGNLGDAGCFSLYATKNIMCGEGGIVTTNNEDYANAIRRFRQHGMSGPYQYEHIGYNYRLTDLQAAIAVEQLKKADEFNLARNKNAGYLNEQLKDLKSLSLPFTAEDRTHVFHQYTIRIKEDSPVSRDDLVAALQAGGIGAGVYYPKPLHLVDHIARVGYSNGDFPETEKAATQVLSLPIHPSVTDKNLQEMVGIIKKAAHVS